MSDQRTKTLKRMARPATPGDFLADLMEQMELTQGQLASNLKVGRQTINHLVNGRRAVTTDMARRLGRYFGNGPTIWLNLQHNVDLWDALHGDSSAYESIQPLDIRELEFA